MQRAIAVSAEFLDRLIKETQIHSIEQCLKVAKATAEWCEDPQTVVKALEDLLDQGH